MESPDLAALAVNLHAHTRASSIAETERFRSLEIDAQLEFGGLVKWDISRIGAPKNRTDDVGEAAIDVR